MVSQAEAIHAAELIYSQAFEGQFESLMSGHFVSNDGLSLVISEQKAIQGFGITSGLTPTPKLLSSVCEWNERNMVGHYWLAEGSDNEHWSLVCGFKYLLEWETLETWTAKIGGICGAYGTLSTTNIGRAREFGGEPYWQSMSSTDVGAAGLVLLGHLG
jgi:hypothetical protein